jgi:ankyrin repeat protein
LDATTGTPLHWAALAGQLEIVKYLLSEGANVHAKVEAYGATAKDIALKNGHLDIVKFLNEYDRKQPQLKSS